MGMDKIQWESFIDGLRDSEALTSFSEDEIVQKLSSLIENTIIAKAKEVSGPIGILFSGGVDSTYIAYILHKHKIPFVAATIGFQDNLEQKLPDDILVARKIAKQYDFSYLEKIFSFDEVEELFREMISILGSELNNVVNVGVGSVELAGITLLQETNPDIKVIFGGLGSEEIFAGYKRHADSLDKHTECWNGLRAMYDRDLLRDFALENTKNISFFAPFLDNDIISFAMNIPIGFKISEESSKIILRKAAIFSGLDKEFALRPKKAAQYGSRTDRAIAKLAKKAGFSYKKDYLAFLLQQV